MLGMQKIVIADLEAAADAAAPASFCLIPRGALDARRDPEPPYTAVIFSSTRTEGDHGYARMSERMFALAAEQPGYLGVEAAREDGLGITVSYWVDDAAAAAWKQVAEHLVAQDAAGPGTTPTASGSRRSPGTTGLTCRSPTPVACSRGDTACHALTADLSLVHLSFPGHADLLPAGTRVIVGAA